MGVGFRATPVQTAIRTYRLKCAVCRPSDRRDLTGQFDPKPSSNHADKLAAQVVTPSFPW